MANTDDRSDQVNALWQSYMNEKSSLSTALYALSQFAPHDPAICSLSGCFSFAELWQLLSTSPNAAAEFTGIPELADLPLSSGLDLRIRGHRLCGLIDLSIARAVGCESEDPVLRRLAMIIAWSSAKPFHTSNGSIDVLLASCLSDSLVDCDAEVLLFGSGEIANEYFGALTARHKAFWFVEEVPGLNMDLFAT